MTQTHWSPLKQVFQNDKGMLEISELDARET